ncbi:MAG TPA: hypothetical protein VFH59_12220, partial [Frateuria sp.]|uniref:hypothetical protein n=1 Tax=Frateuria sp. TaxID=2211372 RepID=UPI002D8049A4
LNLEEAAEFMHLGLKAMKELVDSGAVPALSLNQKHTILLRDDLISYVREQGRAQAELRRKGKPAPTDALPARERRRGPRKARPDLASYEALTKGAQRG